jgi:hypothetical protein
MEALGHRDMETGPFNTPANLTFGIIACRMMLISSSPTVHRNAIWISTNSGVRTFFPKYGVLDRCFMFSAMFMPGVVKSGYNMTVSNGRMRLSA